MPRDCLRLCVGDCLRLCEHMPPAPATCTADPSPCPPACCRLAVPQAQQLDYLQAQAQAGQLERGWPVYREADNLYVYLTGAQLDCALRVVLPA